MEAITRKEKIMSGENLTPITRKELFLAKAAGQDVQTPTPITREEYFLSKISGGGGSTNLPLAYTVSSVDELPSDAVEGSMAVVESQGTVGSWWLVGTPEPIDNPIELEFVAPDSYLSDTVFKAIEMATNSGEFHYLCYSIEVGDETEPVFDDISSTWLSDEWRKIRVIKEPTDEVAKGWLNVNGIKLTEIYTYSNGEWVYKCEVA